MKREKPIAEGVGLGAAIVLGGLFGVATLVCWLIPGRSVLAGLLLTGATVFIVAGCLAGDLSIYRNRMDLGRWPFRRRTVIFADCTQAFVSPDGGGRPQLTFRDGRGKRHRYYLSSGSLQEPAETRIRLLVALLEANGVTVQSRNVLGTGPYTAWQVPAPDLDA